MRPRGSWRWLALPRLEPVGLAEVPRPPRRRRLPPDPAAHPAALYLTRLGPGSRKAQALALQRIARIASAGRTGAVELEWTALGYAECQAIRAELAARSAPATANRHLAALRGVRRECFRLGLISAEELARSADLAGVRGERLPAGRHVSALELSGALSELRRRPQVRKRRPRRGADRGARRRGAAAGGGLGARPGRRGPRRGLACRARQGRPGAAGVPGPGGEEAVGAWIEVRGSEPGALFVGVTKGGAIDHELGRLGPDATLAVLRRRARRAGVADFSAHDLRRTFIGEALEAGATWRRCSSWPDTEASPPPPATTAGRRPRAGRRRGGCGFPTWRGDNPADERGRGDRGR